MQVTHLDDLPTKILVKICNYAGMKAVVQIAQVSSKLRLDTKLTKMWRDIDFMEYTSHIEKGILSMLMQNCSKVELIVFGKHKYVKRPNGLAAVLSHYIETFKAR